MVLRPGMPALLLILFHSAMSGFWHVFIFMYVFRCVSVHHAHAGTHVVQKKESDLLELELQVIVDHLTWVLGTKRRSTARVTTHC